MPILDIDVCGMVRRCEVMHTCVFEQANVCYRFELKL